MSMDHGSVMTLSSCMGVSVGCRPMLNENEIDARWKWISKGHGASSRTQHCPSHSCLNNNGIITQREESERWIPPATTPWGLWYPLPLPVAFSSAHTHMNIPHTDTQVEMGEATSWTNGVLHYSYNDEGHFLYLIGCQYHCVFFARHFRLSLAKCLCALHSFSLQSAAWGHGWELFRHIKQVSFVSVRSISLIDRTEKQNSISVMQFLYKMYQHSFQLSEKAITYSHFLQSTIIMG